MTSTVGYPAVLEGFDETTFLLIGMAMLLSLLTVQIVWAYFNSSNTKRARAREVRAQEASATASDEADADHRDVAETRDTRSNDDVAQADRDADEFDDEMIICPECGNPTEAEYKYCRICVADTGRSYVGGGGKDDSSQSGMF